MSQPDSNRYSSNKPVLIVEDNPVNRDLFSFQLRHYGVATRYAANGQEAVELMEAEPDSFSMILMDLQMPVMDGITATQLIRQKEANTNRRIVIIALTANESSGIQNQCLEAGMDDFVNKPSTLDKIGSILSKWIKET